MQPLHCHRFLICTSTICSISFSSSIGHADELRPHFGVSSTFSNVAVDPESGVCRAAVASKHADVDKVLTKYGPPRVSRRKASPTCCDS
jgi:hypothetical protein